MKIGDLVIYKNEDSPHNNKLGIILGIDKPILPIGEGILPTQDLKYETYYDVLIGEEVFWISRKQLTLCNG